MEVTTNSPIVDVMYVNFTNPGACVEFYCLVDCISCGLIGGNVFWMADGIIITAELLWLEH